MQLNVAHIEIFAHVDVIDGVGQVVFPFRIQALWARLAPFKPEVPEFISVPGWY